MNQFASADEALDNFATSNARLRIMNVVLMISVEVFGVLVILLWKLSVVGLQDHFVFSQKNALIRNVKNGEDLGRPTLLRILEVVLTPDILATFALIMLTTKAIFLFVPRGIKSGGGGYRSVGHWIGFLSG